MNIEKKPAIKKRISLMAAICGLKKGQALRVTTARSGRNLAGLSALVLRKTGKKLRVTTDGDDLLVWIE